MAKKIVEYEIEPNGNCEDCKAEYAGICCAFHSMVRRSYVGKNESNKQQCALCKDFLAAEASKVYCDGCIHSADYYRAHENGCGCELGYKTEYSTNGWYSLNCKSKEQV
jgi:hypothetical protein